MARCLRSSSTPSPRSLQVCEGLRGIKPLTDKDRADIRHTIDEEILFGRRIAISSTRRRDTVTMD